jgi:hypothetical protein
MAEQALDHHHGDMPIQAQATTYHSVMDLFKWGALGTADLLIFLTLAFCTKAGVVTALVVAVLILIVGAVALKGGKKTAAH